MQLKTFLFDDDRGVSPVIGVILMVAITVILAAVIAAFVLGLGDTSDPAPNVNWDYDYDSSDNNVTVTMTSGDTFDPARVSITGDNLDNGKTEGGGVNVTLGTPDTTELTFIDGQPGNSGADGFDSGDTFSSGDSFTVTTASDEFELRIIFESEDGGTSSEIGGTTGPDA